MRYSLLAGGKRIRPVLTLATARSRGARPHDVLPTAAAFELIHTYSLIHDDLPAIDDDTLRRGRPTCHVAFGEDIAILAGDGLFAEAFHLLLTRQAGEPAAVLAAVDRDRSRHRCARHGRRAVHGRGGQPRRATTTCACCTPSRPAASSRPPSSAAPCSRARRTRSPTAPSPPRSACSSRSSTTSWTRPATSASWARASARTAPRTRSPTSRASAWTGAARLADETRARAGELLAALPGDTADLAAITDYVRDRRR